MTMIEPLDEAADAAAIGEAMRAFRRRHLEPAWEQLDRPDPARLAGLVQALAETGLPLAALPEADGGVNPGPQGLCAALAGLGAAVPALGAALVSHLVAQALLVEAGGGRWPAAAGTPGEPLALMASPLDAAAAPGYTLARHGDGWRLDGERRVALVSGGRCVLPARAGDTPMLCVLPVDTAGLAFTAVPSCHGLALLPFGTLRADAVALDAAQVFAWPAGGRAANLGDGLVTALLCGINEELARRAIDYARQRKPAGKMIIEHDAVQQLVGPIELARRPLHALAVATLAASRAGDGSASAFAAPLVRRAALDAIQTLGGYGYMEDYRLERYLRDANTLETSWIHAAQRERAMATQRSASLARGEAA